MSTPSSASLSALSTHMQTTIRHIAALVLLHNGRQFVGGQEQAAAAANEQQPRFVLSHSRTFASSVILQNVHNVMSFVEELFAVRLPRFGIFIVIFAFGIVLAKIVPLVFDDILKRFRVPRHYRACFRYLLQIGIFVLGLWLALASVGIDFVGIVLTFGVVSIVISAGVSGTISNVFSGIMLQTNDMVQLGHDITINGIRGIVVDMSLSSVSLQRVEDDSNTVVVPNNYFSQYPVQIHRQTNFVPGAGASSLDALVLSKQR
jgi:small-conductance mechanosensitive channel